MNEIFHRTSIRNYLDRQIEQEKVEQLLRAAMAAPSAGNQQPFPALVFQVPLPIPYIINSLLSENILHPLRYIFFPEQVFFDFE